MKDGLDFSGSCHFLCTLFSLTFCLWPLWLPATPHAVSEKALHHIHVLCNPLTPCICSSFPLSFRLPLSLTPEIVISPSIIPSLKFYSPPLFFLHLTSSPHYSLHPVPPSRHAKTPAYCDLLCVWVFMCVNERMRAKLYMHLQYVCLLSYTLDSRLVSECFTGQHCIRWSRWSLWW